MLKKRIYLTAATAVTLFIFSNSFLPANESSEISRGLLSVLLDIFPFEISHHLLRKLAHYTEFFAQGLFILLYLKCDLKSAKKTAVISCAIGFITACCDEFIQLFQDGRAAAFTDVLIDFSGTLSSLIFLLIP